jgi:hypothetical protein
MYPEFRPNDGAPNTGSERLDEVFPSMERAVTLPVLLTAGLLVTFRPREKRWREYLDLIWNAAMAVCRGYGFVCAADADAAVPQTSRPCGSLPNEPGLICTDVAIAR